MTKDQDLSFQRGQRPGCDVAARSLFATLMRVPDRVRRCSDLPYREISRDSGREIPAAAMFDVSIGKQMNNGRRVMMLKLGRIAVVSTAALTLAAATIPTKAEAFGFLLGPALLASAFIGAGAYGPGAYGGGGYYGGGCCQVYAPPPCCSPPPPSPCCYYGGAWGGGRGGYYGGGYGGYHGY